MKKTKGGDRMENKSLYDNYIEDPEFKRLMAQEDLIMEVTEGFCEILVENDIKRKKLAELMGRTKGYISQLLNGSRNITLRSLADIAFCLGYKAKVQFVEEDFDKEQNVIDLNWGLKPLETLYRKKMQISDDYLNFGSKISKMAS
jgi:transcriptional regulator with XRE-family HTH domain